MALSQDEDIPVCLGLPLAGSSPGRWFVRKPLVSAEKALCIQYAAASGATIGPGRQSVERYTELDNPASLRIVGPSPQNAEIPETVGYSTAVLGADQLSPRLAANQLFGAPVGHGVPHMIGPAKVRAPQWLGCDIVLIGGVRLARSTCRPTMRGGSVRFI